MTAAVIGKVRALLLLTLAVALVTSCGKKGDLMPPAGYEPTSETPAEEQSEESR